MPFIAAIPPVVATIATVASAAVTTGLSIYQAVSKPSVATAAQAAGQLLRLPGVLAETATTLGFPVDVPEATAQAIEVTQEAFKVLDKEFATAVRGFAEVLKPLADLDPRLRDLIVPLLGMAGKSLPDIASMLALSVGRPRRRFRDVPLQEFGLIDEDITPLGEVMSEHGERTSAAAEQAALDMADAQAAGAARVAEAFETATASLGEITVGQGQAAAAGLEGIKQTIQDAESWLSRAGIWFFEGGAERVGRGAVTIAGNMLTVFLTIFAELVKLAVDKVHDPVAKAITPKFQEFLQSYRDRLTEIGPVRPDQSFALASKAWDAALQMGITAHAYAAVAELAHPVKHLGFPQLAAGLVDLAAFGPVVAHTIGRTMSVGIGRATEWQARRDFRTTFPGLREATEMYLERRISRDELAERLRWEGWPEKDIISYLALDTDEALAVPWREAAPRELGIVFEDVAVDEAWVLGHLKQQGYNDQDAEQLLTGVRLRSSKSFRMGLVSEVLGAYEDGLLTDDDARRFLAPLGLRESSLGLLLDRARLAASRSQATKLLAAQRVQVEQDVIPLDQFRVSARALGFVGWRVEAEAAVIEAKRTGKLLKEEIREGQAQLRELQERTAQVIEERVKRGLATPEDLERGLLELGFESQLATASAELARIRQRPILRLPTALTPEAQAQRVRDLLQDEVLSRVRHETLDPGLAGLHLLALGIPTEEAQALIRLELARIPPSEELEVRRLRTQEALDRFAAGEITEGALRDALRAAGQAEDVAAAMVSRAATDRRIRESQVAAQAQARTQREAAATRARELAEIQRLQQAIILEALRKGELEAADAFQGLQMIGLTAETADLLVTQSVLRAPRAAPRGEG